VDHRPRYRLRVRILLPPSEAKNPGGRGLPLARRRRRHSLDDSRELVLQGLAELLAGPDPAAALLLPDSVAAGAIEDNRRVRTAPTMPALDRYAGIVYDGLFLQPLSDAARAVADRELLIFSGLFGVLRGGDPVPAYRVPAKAALPGVGVLSTFWRPRLAALLPPLLDRGPVIDLRSGDYAAMWQPAGRAEASRLVSVRVLSPRPDGTLGVISFASKLAKGRLAAALLERRATGQPVQEVADLAAAWTVAGGSDLIERPAPHGGTALQLITATATGPAGSTGSARAHSGSKAHSSSNRR